MRFAAVLGDLVKRNRRVRRRSWAGGVWLVYVDTREFALSELPEGVCPGLPVTTNGRFHVAGGFVQVDLRTQSPTLTGGWEPTTEDVRAEDWEVLP